MLDRFMEALDEHLSQHGIITNVILRTERSLFDETETNQIEFYFGLNDEDSTKPFATIHLFPLGQAGTCEIEVEINYPDLNDETNGPAMIWEKAKKVVEEISLAEKRRYTSPERLVESHFLLDYHFIVSLPQTTEEEEMFHQTWDRFAKDLAQLVSL